MKTYSLTIPAGESRQLPGGRFLMLIDTTDPVDVEFFNNTSNINETGSSVEAGYKARPLDGFDKAQITSATTQTVKVGISRGEGGYDRSVGSVDASITVGDTLAVASKTATVSGVVIDAGSAGRKSVTMYNIGALTAYIGNATTGFPLEPGATLTIDQSTASISMFTASGTTEIRVLVEYKA